MVSYPLIKEGQLSHNHVNCAGTPISYTTIPYLKELVNSSASSYIQEGTKERNIHNKSYMYRDIKISLIKDKFRLRT